MRDRKTLPTNSFPSAFVVQSRISQRATKFALGNAKFLLQEFADKFDKVPDQAAWRDPRKSLKPLVSKENLLRF